METKVNICAGLFFKVRWNKGVYFVELKIPAMGKPTTPVALLIPADEMGKVWKLLGRSLANIIDRRPDEKKLNWGRKHKGGQLVRVLKFFKERIWKKDICL